MKMVKLEEVQKILEANISEWHPENNAPIRRCIDAVNGLKQYSYGNIYQAGYIDGIQRVKEFLEDLI